MNTFQTIMSVLGPLLLLAILAAALWGLRKWQAQRTEDEDPSWFLEKADEILQPILFGLITKAEREFGGETGRLKLSTVVEQAMALLPNEVKYWVSSDWICARIEVALEKAKVLWGENPALLESGIVLISEEVAEG